MYIVHVYVHINLHFVCTIHYIKQKHKIKSISLTCFTLFLSLLHEVRVALLLLLLLFEAFTAAAKLWLWLWLLLRQRQRQRKRKSQRLAALIHRNIDDDTRSFFALLPLFVCCCCSRRKFVCLFLMRCFSYCCSLALAHT